MDLRTPMSSVVPGAAGHVLMVLSRTTEELTGNVIATLTDGAVSQTGTNKALKRLVADGLVVARPAGNSILYALNREHVAAGAIVELTELRSTLLARIVETVTGWQYPPVTVALFGSAARRDGTSESDIDLLVIRPDDIDQEDTTWAAPVMELADLVQRWSGNLCEILEYSQAELARLAASDDTLIDNLRTDAITLFGAPIRALTGAKR